MSQAFLPALLRLVAFALLGALALIVGTRLLNGSISTSGLCTQKTGAAKGHLSAERVQLLLFTLAVAATYVGTVVTSADRGTLPSLDGTWLAVGTASNGIYAISKTIRFALDRWGAQRLSPSEHLSQREPAS